MTPGLGAAVAGIVNHGVDLIVEAAAKPDVVVVTDGDGLKGDTDAKVAEDLRTDPAYLAHLERLRRKSGVQISGAGGQPPAACAGEPERKG